MAAKHFLEHSDGAQARCGLQQRDDLGVPDSKEWVGPPPGAWSLPLGGQTGIGVKASAGGGADARPGRGDLAGVGPTMVHVQSRLLVGDVRAGQRRSPRERTATPAQTSRHRRLAPRKETDLAGPDLKQGYTPSPVSPGNHHPDRR